jgi:hypothetical protein
MDELWDNKAEFTQEKAFWRIKLYALLDWDILVCRPPALSLRTAYM